MELSEAKEVLKNIKRCCLDDEQYQKYGFMEQYTDISDVEAIETVLKALEEQQKEIEEITTENENLTLSQLDFTKRNISKDKIREKIKELKSIEPRDDEYNYDLQNEVGFKLDVLNELLGE